MPLPYRPHLAPPADAPQVAEQLRQILESQPLTYAAGRTHYTATGAESYPPPEGDLEPHRLVMQVVEVDENDREHVVSRWLVTVEPLPLSRTVS
jgi:hypothetical protein